MTHSTHADRRRVALDAGRGRVALAAAAALLMLVTGCAALTSPGSEGAPGATATPGATLGNSLPAEAPAVGRKSATSGGALFGGNNALALQQQMLGRRLAIIRVYYQIGEPFPAPQDQQAMAGGSTLLISLATGGASYASVASGFLDARILAFLRSVNRAAVQYHLGAIYVSFAHEPDGPQHRWLGPAAQFVRAWDHVHMLARSAGLDWGQGGRLHWVWILIHSSFGNGMASQYWPGAGQTDIVGADGYNSYACKVARHGGIPGQAASNAVTPASIFDPAIRFADVHGGLPVFISEWGSDLAPAGGQSTFIRQMEAYVASNREIGAVMYWDSGHRCNYSVNRSPMAIAALSNMGHSAALQGRVTAPAGQGGPPAP
jgi:hypothetical protein